jgi:S-adenosylmethionine uptake transporter
MTRRAVAEPPDLQDPMPIPRSNTAGLGVVLYLAGVAMFAVNDALGKWLVADYGVGQLMLLRTIGAAVVLAPMLLSLRVKLVDFRRPGLQVLRVLFAAADTFAFYYATRTMPLADVMTFYMATPLIITALSAPLLGEKVERFRWIAVLVGFVGVLIALRPSPQMFSWGAPIALFGAIAYAFSQTITRDLRGIHWAPLVLWQFVGSGLIGAATIPWAWTTPSLFDLGLMFLVGVVAMICIICVVRALGFARVAVLAPLQYTGLLWAAILGWLVWGDVPTLPIVVGNAIIIGSGLYVAARGKMVGKAVE